MSPRKQYYTYIVLIIILVLNGLVVAQETEFPEGHLLVGATLQQSTQIGRTQYLSLLLYEGGPSGFVSEIELENEANVGDMLRPDTYTGEGGAYVITDIGERYGVDFKPSLGGQPTQLAFPRMLALDKYSSQINVGFSLAEGVRTMKIPFYGDPELLERADPVNGVLWAAYYWIPEAQQPVLLVIPGHGEFELDIKTADEWGDAIRAIVGFNTNSPPLLEFSDDLPSFDRRFMIGVLPATFGQLPELPGMPTRYGLTLEILTQNTSYLDTLMSPDIRLSFNQIQLFSIFQEIPAQEIGPGKVIRQVRYVALTTDLERLLNDLNRTGTLGAPISVSITFGFSDEAGFQPHQSIGYEFNLPTAEELEAMMSE